VKLMRYDGRWVGGKYQVCSFADQQRRIIMTTQAKMQTARYEVQVMGVHLLTTVKKIIHEGNVRRIIIRHKEHTIAEFPLTIGVIGTMLAPAQAALGAISALLTNCTIEVERIEPPVELETHRSE
jgi:hypothetical protein